MARADNRLIPPYRQTDWQAVRALPVNDCGEPLQRLEAADFWQIRPAYAEAGIAGAITAVYLREAVCRRLRQAAQCLRQQGFTLCVLDGWRPPAVQKALYLEMFLTMQRRYPHEDEAALHRRTQCFVALPCETPAAPSPHVTGGAVDVCLADGNGALLEMGSAFDEPSRRSYTAAFENEEGVIRLRRQALYRAMAAAGFANLPSEWWHYDFGNQNWAHFTGQPCARYGLIYPEDYGNSAV